MSEQADNIFISIEDGTKPEQEFAPSRKVRVELRYFLEEGDDYESKLHGLGNVVSSRVAALLGRAPVSVQPVTDLGEIAKRTRRTKEQIAADKAAEEAAKVAPPSDPTALEDPTELPQSGDGPTASTTEATPGMPAAGDPTDPAALDEDFTVQPEPTPTVVETQVTPISDGDLNAAVQKRNGELASADGTKAIRALIATFNPDPTKVFQLREIDAGRRAEFLNGLNAIV